MYPAPIQSLSRVRTFVTPWTVACQAPLSVGFSRQEYWSGLPFPSPGDLPNPGMESGSPALAGGFFATVAPGKACVYMRARACVCVCVCVLVAQPHPTLCRSVDYSLPGYSVCGISRQEYCSGFAMPSSRDLPDPGIKLESPVLQADPLPLGPPGSPVCICLYLEYEKQGTCFSPTRNQESIRRFGCLQDFSLRCWQGRRGPVLERKQKDEPG